MPKKKIPCAQCGKPMHVGSGSKPAGLATCQPCRRIQPQRHAYVYKLVCGVCGEAFEAPHKRKYCTPECSNSVPRRPHVNYRPADHKHVKRRKLESSAPGLSTKQRLALLKEWRRKGAICVYCRVTPASTVDHVLPLVLGGTNFEGNLVPCCRECNSSKAGMTVTEWRHGRRVNRRSVSMPKRPRMDDRAAKIRSVKYCPICSTPTASTASTCGSKECQAERQRRYMRDKYRLRAGLPVDPNLPSGRYMAEHVASQAPLFEFA